MYDTDFGGIVRARPATVARVSGEAAVVRALAEARRSGLAVTVRGAGHSCHGQTVSDGGALLVTVPRPSTMPALRADGSIDVPAAARWRDVERWLNARGRSVPVLADYLDLSVGGTLSVGGYGVDSVVHGAQVDHVERLRLVTPAGAALWCSGQENRELFSYALAGLGQLGIIERVVLRTVPYRPATTLFTYRHRSLEDMLDAMAWLPAVAAGARPHLAKGLASRGRFLTTWGALAHSLGEARTTPPPGALRGRAQPHRLATLRYRQLRDLAVRAWLLRFPFHRRLWCDYLLDYDGLRSFARFLRPLLARDAFHGCLRALYVVPIRRMPRPVPLPLEAMGSGGQPMMFGIGLYSMIPPWRGHPAAAIAASVARCLDACLERGGRPYLYGWHDMNDAQWRAAYGPAYDRLLELKREVDPAGLYQRNAFRADAAEKAAC